MQTDSQDMQVIEDLVRTLFTAFDTGPDVADRLDQLRSSFLPNATIARTCGDQPALLSMDEFFTTRKRWLTDGTLCDFSERELRGRIEIFGDIAHYLCSYAKSGVRDGMPFTGRGVKSIQLVRTTDGWRVNSVAWDDERPGVALKASLLPASHPTSPDGSRRAEHPSARGARGSAGPD